MKAFILILFFLLSGTLLFSDEPDVASNGSDNPSIKADTLILFQENFDDGEFTTNPAWSPSVTQMCAPQPAKLSIVDGAFKIQQQDARTCGNWSYLIIELNIPITDSTKIQFDVKPSYSSVENGSGYRNVEFPVGLRFKLINQRDEFMNIWFCYNYRGGASFFYKDFIKLVFPYCDQDAWIRNEVYRIRDFFPDAKAIIELKIAASGWDYEGYADNIKIYNSSENIDPKGLDETLWKPVDLSAPGISRHQKAIEDYKENLRLSGFGDNQITKAKWLQKVCDAYYQLNEFDSALVYLNKTIEIIDGIEQSKKNQYLAESYILLSKVYALQSEYNKALNSLDNLSEVYKIQNDTAGLIRALDDKAEIFSLTGNIDEAEACYLEMINLCQSSRNMALTGKTFQKLGDLYLVDSLFEQSLNNYLEALDVFKKTGDLNSAATLFFDLGNIFFMMKNYDQAIENLNKSLETARLRNLESLLSDIYLKLSEVYDEKGDKEIALSYFKLYSKTRTILFDKEKNQVLAEQYVKYETERKDQQIGLLTKDNEIQELNIKQKSNQLYFTIAFGGLAILLLVFIYLRYRSKQKANEMLIEKNELITIQKHEIEQQVKEKETMLRELHHRVKNNLQTIYSMLSIQSRKLKDPEALAIIKPNIDRVWAMALIHHKLYRDENLTSINISQYVNELVENVLRTNWTGDREISVKQNVEVKYLEADIAIPLGLLINELMVNAVKHAFESVKNPEFNISIKESKSKELTMLIKDNGPGIPEKYIADHSNSFGLELINLLVTQLKGEMEIVNNKGACFTFIFKQCHIETLPH